MPDGNWELRGLDSLKLLYGERTIRMGAGERKAEELMNHGLEEVLGLDLRQSFDMKKTWGGVKYVSRQTSESWRLTG